MTRLFTSLKITITIRRFLVLVLFILASCAMGPIPASEDSSTIIKADTIYKAQGSWITGPELYFYPTQEDSSSSLSLFIIIASLSTIIVLSVWFLLRNRRKIHTLQHSLEQVRKEVAHHETLLGNRDSSDAVIVLLQEKIKMVKTLLDKHDAMKQKEGMTYMDQLEALQEAVQGYNSYLEELRSDKHYLGDLEKALNAGRDGIMQKARTLFGKTISEDDYHVLSCYFAGMDAASISFITGIQPGTIRTKKSRIKTRLMDFPESEEKEAVISTLMNGL